ncbi:hypothetical protein [Paraburkholderia caballeronis]|uniref:Phage tail protein n=1 Tax=Paraburkholderia caballeronis TaxID=416943 RepID=A0A1H7VRL9_9BURK|nr:hypothetical protein [Paraburkholderia caballeronis]PXW15487.1 hypothetical protein C7403_12550 [Paraburkholderia caballeronis]PXW93772.1 hypothetical protein C7407_12550 [Paraburkholderia caballeronis]RAJ89012.1 hypothetical protein C7409_12550 [Paraburkholderia caballeronis]SED99315.1 hypothetical protein SAMN05445871_4420 [Paraburkholderia caballeronis]SEM11982.1 hypothetical protein SAMN05192542_12723 [Paraburkholderia caballeronis]
MNLEDQIGALEAGVDQLIQVAAAAPAAQSAEPASVAIEQPAVIPETSADAVTEQPAGVNTPVEAAETAVAIPSHDDDATAETSAPDSETAVAVAEAETADATAAEPPTLQVGRPSQNEITMTIGGQTVSLHPMQVGQLIEELANARASMLPEPPPDIPPGWRFASTRNPVMAVQKQSNGDRLLVMRHTGHGWVPFTFSPDMVIQMYMMLTQR